MKETEFIKQKEKSWRRFEALQKSGKADPNELTKLFVEITDDLSYARTYYQKRSVRVYLNYLAQLVVLKVNKNKKVNFSRFVRFFTHSLPMEFARSWKAMTLALVVFVGALMVGVVSSANDIEYAKQIMGEGYIKMTDENIANGDPMAVYHQHGSSVSSTFRLTQNNTRVAALTYTAGIGAGVPTIIIMIQNGIMLGAFHYYLYFKDVLFDSIWVIWIHGVLEISAIIIAGGAGLVLGGGLLFPGTYTRLQSLRISAKRSFKIALSCIFILIISGFLEGSVTRYTQMPMFFKYILVLGSLLFIIFYFISYPMYLYRNHIKTGHFVFNDDIPHQKQSKVTLGQIRDSGEVFTDGLNLYRQVFGTVFKGFVGLILPLCLLVASYHFWYDSAYDSELYWWKSFEFTLFGSFENPIYLLFLTLIISSFFSVLFYALTIYQTNSKFKYTEFLKFSLFSFYKLWPVLLMLCAIYFVASKVMFFVVAAIFPVVILLSYSGFFKKGKYNKVFSEGRKLTLKNWFGHTGAFLLMFLLPGLLMLVGYSIFGNGGLALLGMVTSFILEHIQPFVNDVLVFANAMNFIFYISIGFFIISFITTGLVIQFHSVRERKFGLELFKRLDSFGTKNNVFEQIDEGEF